MRLSPERRAFFRGMLAALAVVALHDQETLYREIIATDDEIALVYVARQEELLESAGLIKYGYAQSA